MVLVSKFVAIKTRMKMSNTMYGALETKQYVFLKMMFSLEMVPIITGLFLVGLLETD